jgi:hypothetical protein
VQARRNEAVFALGRHHQAVFALGRRHQAVFSPPRHREERSDVAIYGFLIGNQVWIASLRSQ